MLLFRGTLNVVVLLVMEMVEGFRFWCRCWWEDAGVLFLYFGGVGDGVVVVGALVCLV